MPAIPSDLSPVHREVMAPIMGIMMPMKASTGSTCPRLSAPMTVARTRVWRADKIPNGTPMTMAPIRAPGAHRLGPCLPGLFDPLEGGCRLADHDGDAGVGRLGDHPQGLPAGAGYLNEVASRLEHLLIESYAVKIRILGGRKGEVAPESPEMHFALGRAYARAGRVEDAARARATFAELDRRLADHHPAPGDRRNAPLAGIRPR